MFKKFCLVVFVLAALNTIPVSAAVRCETQYGGGETCVRTGQLQVDKKVWNRTVNNFVDNLTLSDSLLLAGQEVIFKIKVKNIGDADLSNVTVTDTLPSYLVASSGGFTYTIANLPVGATDERELRAKVVSADKLPLVPSTFCVVDLAEAKVTDSSDRDTSQVCIENRVKGTVIPATGPEMGVLALLPALGAAGWFLRKVAP